MVSTLSGSGQEVPHDQRGSGRAALDEAEEGTEVSGGGKAREIQAGHAHAEGVVEHGEAVRDHLPKDQQAWVDRKLAAAFNHDDPAKGERACRDLAAQLEARWPDAAASLREGLEDMFTVRRLGVGGRLAASLTNTNCIESMISIARDTTRNVKRWRDGKMIKRWCAAGMLNAENSFRRLKGYRQMPTFVAALARHVEAVTPACDAARVA
jgi:mutator family transposase